MPERHAAMCQRTRLGTAWCCGTECRHALHLSKLHAIPGAEHNKLEQTLLNQLLDNFMLNGARMIPARAVRNQDVCSICF